ncbi:hypothetical protein GQ55_5G447700 [Panicum hallii var. hallii]|uniref:Uncharacterized protein n=1 Tax=Panicum hallii var. hallii TaxID=1504633 RepID=A0A2T7DQ31_9POAL|nr:hypothetical protein GQ55_5G447700 [Panicum hallii var. hallii]
MLRKHVEIGSHCQVPTSAALHTDVRHDRRRRLANHSICLQAWALDTHKEKREGFFSPHLDLRGESP